MKKSVILFSLVLSIINASCVYDEVIDEPTSVEPVTPPVIEETIVLTDTMSVSIVHSTDTLSLPVLYGKQATIIEKVQHSGNTRIRTLGTDSFVIDDLLEVDTISISY